MNRQLRSKVCFEKTKQSAKLMMQLPNYLISTSTSVVVIETSLMSPVDTKPGPESCTISYRFCSHENGTVRYRIVPISGSLFRTARFLDLFWNGPLNFFRTRVNDEPKWNCTISYPCEQDLTTPLFDRPLFNSNLSFY